MNDLCRRVLEVLRGKTLVTAESCTGGGIGAALTAIPGSSEVYKGGVICYTDWVKTNLLGVDAEVLKRNGAVSEQVALQMAMGVRNIMCADVAIAVTGLAGPGGDEFDHEVGTVYIGYDSQDVSCVKIFHFSGNREDVRLKTVKTSLELILEYNK